MLGSYVFMDKLGEGGMGAVFQARNWKLSQIVALKLIRKERLTNRAARRLGTFAPTNRGTNVGFRVVLLK